MLTGMTSFLYHTVFYLPFAIFHFVLFKPLLIVTSYAILPLKHLLVFFNVLTLFLHDFLKSLEVLSPAPRFGDEQQLNPSLDSLHFHRHSCRHWHLDRQSSVSDFNSYLMVAQRNGRNPIDAGST